MGPLSIGSQYISPILIGVLVSEIQSKTHMFTVMVFNVLQTSCSVDSDKDAEIAMQVSNALIKALLQYRLKHLHPSVSIASYIHT